MSESTFLVRFEHFYGVEDVLEPRGVGIGLRERIREVGQALHPV